MVNALFNLGFRPFFLLGSLFSALAMGLWIGPYFPVAVDWHAHEMVYGFAAAIVAGFLLTAVRNWTGLPTLERAPLAMLGGLWLVARILSLNGKLAVPAAAFDLIFLLGLLGAIARPIWRVRQWRQWGVLTCVALLMAGQGLFAWALVTAWPEGARLGVLTGLYAIFGLLFIIARRVMPFFTERGVDYPVHLRQFALIDRIAMPLFSLFAGLAMLFPQLWLTRTLAATLAMIHCIRLWGWYTPGIWRRPLLWILFLAYGWLVAGFALAAYDLRLALHAWTVGGLGVMILGMICRVSLGHTGRSIHHPPREVIGLFILLLLAAILRTGLPWLSPESVLIGYRLAGVCWSLAFVGFSILYGPMLWRPRADGKPG